MAKKIRFPLVMADDTEVRDLDELREHFDLEAVLGYYESGKLLTWLRDRYLEDEADAVEELDKSKSEFQQQLCAIFGVDYTAPVDQEAVVRRQERLKKLRTFTDEEEFIDHIDQVAFDQEELADLLDEGVETIYLCGKQFSIPVSSTERTFIGINNPTVKLSGVQKHPEYISNMTFHDISVENPLNTHFRRTDFTAEVKEIGLGIGKRGFHTIKLLFKEPVTLDGVKHDHISVETVDAFESLALSVGDIVRIPKGEDEFPSITVESRGKGDKIHLPERCPSCGKEMVIKAKKLKCNNFDCNANHAGRILNFCEHAGIKGLGESAANDLVNAGFKNIVDVLEKDPADFEKAGISEERAVSLQKSLKTAIAEMRDYEVLAAIGIPGVGKETAKTIIYNVPYKEITPCKQYDDPLFSFSFGTVRFGNRKPLDLGSTITSRKYIISSPASDSNKPLFDILKGLEKYITKFTTKEDFENMRTVGHTGGNPSEDVKKLIRDLGWSLVDGKEFDYLIVPSYDHESSKVKTAEEKDREILTEADFIKRFSKNLKSK